MGLDVGFGTAFAKSQIAAFGPLPTKGTVFISVANRDKRFVIFPVKRLADLGFEIVATAGTASMLRRHGVEVTSVRKFSQGTGPDGEKTIVQAILDGEIDLIFNTPHGLSPDGRPAFDGYEIRTAAVMRNVPCVTTVQGLAAAVQGIEAIMAGTSASARCSRGEWGMTAPQSAQRRLLPGTPGADYAAAAAAGALPRRRRRPRAGPRADARGCWPGSRAARRARRAAHVCAGPRRPVEVFGVRFPGVGRAGRGDGQERRRAPGLGGAGLRPRRAGHGDRAAAAGQRPAAAVPAARERRR